MSGKLFANKGQIFQTVAAITSACAGLTSAYFVLKSNNSLPRASAIMCASGAVFLFVLGIMIGRKSGPLRSEGTREVESNAGRLVSPVSAEARVVDSGNATGTGGSATATGGHVNVFLPPALVPSPAAPAPTHLAPKQRVIHLCTSKPVVRRIHLDGQLVWRIGKNEGYRGETCTGILMPIYFDAVRSDPGTYMEYVKGHLIFRDGISHEELRVDHACWIDGTTLDHTEMSLGETKHLVLAVMSDTADGKAMILSTNRTDYDSYRADNPKDEFESQELPTGKYDLSIVITWSGKGRQIFELPFELSELLKQQP
jgi:hypothetical protein